MNQPAEDRVDATPGPARRPRDDRYSRGAIILHWAIAAFIIFNLASGFLIWELASGFFDAPANRGYYVMGLIFHISSGMTVLALTIVRIAWRLTHEPPAYPADMKRWESNAARFAHFLLYAAMVLMPLTGWAIMSANPPVGSPGAAAGPPRAGRGGPPIWWVVPLPLIEPIQNIGREPGGVKPQEILHDQFADWHEIGGWLTLLLLMLHVSGALKHQWLDRQPELQRMGIGRRQ